MSDDGSALNKQPDLNLDGLLTAIKSNGQTLGSILTTISNTLRSSPVFAGTVPGVFTGSGAPTISAPKGSLYLRTDGSSTTTRAYVATDAVGGWTYLTAGA